MFSRFTLFAFKRFERPRPVLYLPLYGARPMTTEAAQARDRQLSRIPKPNTLQRFADKLKSDRNRHTITDTANAIWGGRSNAFSPG